MTRHRRPALWSFVCAILLAASAACNDPPPNATPAPDRGESSTSGSASAQTQAPSATTPAPVASGSVTAAPVADLPPADLSRGVQLDEIVAPGGVLKEGEADRILKTGEAPKVILLSSGEEPRSALSYSLKPKTKQRSTMKMDMTMKMTMAGAPSGMPDGVQLPQIVMGIDLETGDKSGDRDIQVVATVAEVKLNAKGDQQEQMATAMKAQMAAMKGLTIHSVIDDKGRSRDVKVDVPANAPPEAVQMMTQMKNSMEQMVAPLPEGDVGLGAQWQVVTRVNSGADILQWTTYTLKKRDGTKVTLDGQVKQAAASAKLSGGQLPAGMSADIQAFRSNGTGLTLLDLAALAPERGTGDVTSSLSIVAGPRSMTVDSSVKVTFTSK